MRNFSIDIVWAKIQMAVAAIGGWLGYFLGGMDGLMIALIIFMILDYITGLMCAVIDKKLSSAVGFKGICKKVLILMLVGVANVVDIHIVGTGSALRSAVICFYLSNEGLSLLENAAHIGLPIPDKMKDYLLKKNNKGRGFNAYRDRLIETLKEETEYRIKRLEENLNATNSDTNKPGKPGYVQIKPGSLASSSSDASSIRLWKKSTFPTLI